MGFVHGPATKPPVYWPKVRKRVLWSIKRAGYAPIPIRYHFRTYLKHGQETLCGYAYLNEKSGSVWISTGLNGPRSIFVDTVLHEVAHILSHRVEDPTHPHDHSDLWGVIYARLYRAYVDESESGPR